MDQNTRLIGTGVAGALLSMLCCFTPVLIILLSALGLTAFVASLDYVLVPLFVAHPQAPQLPGQEAAAELI